MLGQWFSHVGVAHTNSVAKVFQSLLLTCKSFRLLVFGTNLIAFRWDQSNCLLAVPRHSLAGQPLFGRWLDIRFAIAVATARPVSSRCRHLATTHVTQDRTRHSGYPAVQLRLTSDQICTGSESFHVKYGAKEKKRNGNHWEPCQHTRSLASNQHWTLDTIYVL